MAKLLDNIKSSFFESLVQKIVDNKSTNITIEFTDKPGVPSIEKDTPLTLQNILDTKKANISINFEDKKGN